MNGTAPDHPTIGDDRATVEVAPDDGGRIAAIVVDGVELIVRRDTAPDASGPLAWGSYPMVPWAGRVRHGTFEFDGRTVALPRNMGAHAIHGVGFTSTWSVAACDDTAVDLTLTLPSDERWPFGGRSDQRIEVFDDRLRLELSVTAGDRAFPASLGWHPWYRKPDRLDFHPTAMYRRDDEGIAVDELVEVPPRPWDDCFVNDRPIGLTIDGVELTLTSSCTRWVVYDEPAHATCVEPQTGPPDAFNIEPNVLEPGATLTAWYEIAY